MANRNNRNRSRRSRINFNYFWGELCSLAGIAVDAPDIFPQSVGESILSKWRQSETMLKESAKILDGYRELNETLRTNLEFLMEGSEEPDGEPVIVIETHSNVQASTSQQNAASSSASTEVSTQPQLRGTPTVKNLGSQNAPKLVAHNGMNCNEHPSNTPIIKNKHRVAYQSEGNFQCNCSKTFVDLEALHLHIRQRTEEWKYPCPSCDAVFFFPTELMQHQQKLKRCRMPTAYTFSGIPHRHRRKRTHKRQSLVLCKNQPLPPEEQGTSSGQPWTRSRSRHQTPVLMPPQKKTKLGQHNCDPGDEDAQVDNHVPSNDNFGIEIISISDDDEDEPQPSI